jgi:hypothetical protein
MTTEIFSPALEVNTDSPKKAMIAFSIKLRVTAFFITLNIIIDGL